MVKDAERPGDINQGLIELGSTVCKVRDPVCKECPLKDHCGAYLETTKKAQEVEDIEELCSICEPVLPDEDRGVTRYPMKVERKKAREEDDLVNVIEWRSSFGDRHFVLARRPETGLLAGLYEFPTLPNVKDCSTTTASRQLGEEVLQSVLKEPPAGGSVKSQSNAQAVHISNITAVGDVLHIFSHIRKTYSVQWILLEGGESPPVLSGLYSCAAVTAPESKKAKVGKRPKDSGKRPEKITDAAQLQWIGYEDVARAKYVSLSCRALLLMSCIALAQG